MKITQKLKNLTNDLNNEILKESVGTFEIARLMTELRKEINNDRSWIKYCTEHFNFHDTRCWQFISINNFKKTLSKLKMGRSKLCLLGGFKLESRLKKFISQTPNIETCTYIELLNSYNHFHGKSTSGSGKNRFHMSFQDMTKAVIKEILSDDFNLFKNKKIINDLESAISKAKKKPNKSALKEAS